MFKLTSLNLNGIRSATSKGLEPWLAETRPDCICVQEVKAQAADISGKFEQLAGLTGHFHFAERNRLDKRYLIRLVCCICDIFICKKLKFNSIHFG